MGDGEKPNKDEVDPNADETKKPPVPPDEEDGTITEEDLMKTRLADLEEKAENTENVLKEIARTNALLGKGMKAIGENLGLDMKELDQLASSKNPSDAEPPEQKPGEEEYGEAGAPGKTPMLTSGGKPTAIKALSARDIESLVRKAVDKAVERKIVVRKGMQEQVSPEVKTKAFDELDNGSIESQLEIAGF